MARHAVKKPDRSAAKAITVTFGLALITMAGFAVAWIALPAVGASIMAVSGGSLAMALR